MAYSNIDDFDLPPKVTVRVAQTDEENRQGLQSFAMFQMMQGGQWDNWSNDDFITLCEEPEMLVEMTPLAREILVRWSGERAMAKNPDAGLDD